MMRLGGSNSRPHSQGLLAPRTPEKPTRKIITVFSTAHSKYLDFTPDFGSIYPTHMAGKHTRNTDTLTNKEMFVQIYFLYHQLVNSKFSDKVGKRRCKSILAEAFCPHNS